MGKEQLLITNWFDPQHPLATQRSTLNSDPPAGYLRKSTVVTSNGRGEFTAKAQGIVGDVGNLSLYEDHEGGNWINNISVMATARTCGVATKMYLAAKKEFGEVYASTQIAENDTEGDTRHLTNAGRALVTALIRNGHMKPEWFKNPVN
ncbi:MAG: hypothetical protein ACJAVM_000583 [Sulfitobacter sp.]|jgi:hypothetical protein